MTFRIMSLGATKELNVDEDESPSLLLTASLQSSVKSEVMNSHEVTLKLPFGALAARINIFVPNYIIFTEVAASLHFDQH